MLIIKQMNNKLTPYFKQIDNHLYGLKLNYDLDNPKSNNNYIICLIFI